MIDRFALCLSFTLGAEGGFVSNPRDPGGATFEGITLASLRDWLDDPDATVADLEGLHPENVKRFYRDRYWDVARCGWMPPGVDLMVFDHAVNAGDDCAAVLLQRVLAVDDNGRVGPQTLGAIKGRDVAALIEQLRAAQEASYRCSRYFVVFGHGWMKRLVARHARALAMAKASV